MLNVILRGADGSERVYSGQGAERPPEIVDQCMTQTELRLINLQLDMNHTPVALGRDV